MNHKKTIIKSLVSLGEFISQFTSLTPIKSNKVLYNDVFFEGFKNQLKLASENNGWYTKSNLCYAMKQWSKLLQNDPLKSWLEPYLTPTANPKTIAVVMPGNIPLVGFHDFISVLASGHEILVKQSSKDLHIIPYLANYLAYLTPGLKSKIKFTNKKLKKFDAVIATGSDNTAKYFELYFKNKPSIIRKNRNSIAVLNGSESKIELESLAEDVFRYYGLGCRSVSKLFIPRNYDFDKFFNAIYNWRHIMDSEKYTNNYDYNKAVYLMSEFDFIENGFLMLKKDTNYASPIATLFYEFYDDLETLKQSIKTNVSKIQCVVSKDFTENEIKFGNTQCPSLDDYADDIDTVNFLLKI